MFASIVVIVLHLRGLLIIMGALKSLDLSGSGGNSVLSTAVSRLELYIIYIIYY